MISLENVDRSEIARFMGIKGEADSNAKKLIEEALFSLLPAVSPRFVKRNFLLKTEKNSVFLGDWEIKSASLAAFLSDADEAILFCATLGSGADRQIQKNLLIRPSLALAQQACAAAMIEAFCDSVCLEFAEEMAQKNLSPKPRFSPGYGDFSLDCQEKILSLLDAQRKIGVTITDASLLTPTKTVTALVGFSEKGRGCPEGGCGVCTNRFCVFNRDFID